MMKYLCWKNGDIVLAMPKNNRKVSILSSENPVNTIKISIVFKNCNLQLFLLPLLFGLKNFLEQLSRCFVAGAQPNLSNKY